MAFTTSTRFNVTAAVLALAVSLAGSIHASATHASATSGHRAGVRHATSRHEVTRQANVHRVSSRHTRRHRESVHRHPVSLGQRTMDSQRAIEIQQALIQAHYLDGGPTGQWDPATQAAMEKYQTDNGWQAKITPDSRALIKLGLGPKQDEGEYPANPTGVSKLTDTASADIIRTMATAEVPSTTQN